MSDPRAPQVGSNGESSDVELAKPESGDARRQPVIVVRQTAVGLSEREERGKGDCGSAGKWRVQEGSIRQPRKVDSPLDEGSAPRGRASNASLLGLRRERDCHQPHVPFTLSNIDGVATRRFTQKATVHPLSDKVFPLYKKDSKFIWLIVFSSASNGTM